MSFERPLLLLTLLVIPLAVVLYLLAERRRMKYAIRFTNLDVLAGVVGGPFRRRYVPLALFLLALAALCVGTARPQHTTLVPRDRATVILVIDVSRSMEAKDVKPSRIGAATAAVRTFLDRVPSRLQVGLIAFAGDPAVAAPPTTNHDLVRKSLDTIEWFPSFGGTAIGDALAAAVKLGQQAVGGQNSSLAAAVAAAPDEQTKGLVSILFLSDGAQTRGDLEPLDGADRARAAGIPVYTVALGTPNGTLTFGGGGGGTPGPTPFGGRRVPVPPDPATLKAIADRTGGQFFAAQSAKSLQAAYSKLGSRLGRRPGKSEITYGFLAAAAGLLLAAGVLSALWSPGLP
ncbi:MAG: VWA domain-containing protein [Actinobacteria bacterium]|nr:VWA domain-containing protein [Actinomycetota bacterium]